MLSLLSSIPTRCIFFSIHSSLSSILSRYSFAAGPQDEPNRILLVTVHHMLYPMTVEVLHQVFSPYGFVEKIVTFQKSAGQILPVSTSHSSYTACIFIFFLDRTQSLMYFCTLLCNAYFEVFLAIF
jgi:polypyrimidine tract-binding protein 2